MSSSIVVAGIDVGGTAKGFHAVALRGSAYLDKFNSRDVLEVASWCREIDTQYIGIDAPCRWSQKGGSRLAERSLAQKKMHCFATPTRERAEGRNFYRWMFNGEKLYQALAGEYELFDGTAKSGRICFETFPHAIMCSLDGLPVKAGGKATTRRAALESRGYGASKLANIDFVDAALCAFTAEKFRTGHFASYGDCEEGIIVVPV